MFALIGLVEDFISPSLYELKAPYYMEAEGIIVHNTYNNASAKSERQYVINNPKPTSYHIAVDDKDAIQLIPFDRSAFHAGNGYANRNYIGLEICYSKDGGERFEKAEDNAVKIIADIILDKNWTTENVKFHKDFANKNCPHRTNTDEFIDDIEEEINSRGYRIVNKPTATIEQVIQWAKSKNASQTYIDLIPTIFSISEKYGVDPLVVSVQCALETGYLKKGNSKSGGHNPAGIKASNGSYAKYDSWEDGIEAQVKLLAKYSGVYGNKDSWLYGKCPTVEGLTNLWAENSNYHKLLLTMIGEVKSIPSEDTSSEIQATVYNKDESLIDKLKNNTRNSFSLGKKKIQNILKR